MSSHLPTGAKGAHREESPESGLRTFSAPTLTAARSENTPRVGANTRVLTSHAHRGHRAVAIPDLGPASRPARRRANRAHGHDRSDDPALASIPEAASSASRCDGLADADEAGALPGYPDSRNEQTEQKAGQATMKSIHTGSARAAIEYCLTFCKSQYTGSCAAY